jgi:DNA-binding MarR family transcriptional regulator
MTPSRPDSSDLLMFVSGYLHRVLRAEARQHGIRWNALMVLNDLNLGGPCTQRLLADLEQIRAPTMSLLLQQMEKRGWVERTAHESDARATLVRITADGRAALKKANGVLKRRIDEELARVPENVREEARRALLPLASVLMGAVRAHAADA